jgi:hypothetical protein
MSLLKSSWVACAITCSSSLYNRVQIIRVLRADGACFPAMIALHRYLPLWDADFAADPIAFAGAADVLATVVVFLGSMLWNNSSMYDPYWSVAPAVM